MNQNIDCKFKVIIDGALNTGKQQLLCELLQKQFDKNAIGLDFGIQIIQYQNKIAKLQIWDTHRSYNHMKLAISYYKVMHIALLVFDVGQIETFTLCSLYIEQVRSQSPKNVQIMLIGQQFTDARQVNVDEETIFAEMNKLTYTEVNYLEDTKETMSQLKYRIAALAINNEIK
ncbi:Rab2a [Hexamita inflata]|uniref:Rab2a n=1 Tax=Hexamita inflata TaxID=28002 RepID=A0ABP1HGD2_9EUKA